MKKKYLFVLVLFSFMKVSSQWAGFNNNGGDNLWSNDLNWALPGGVTELASDQTISVYVNPEFVTLDESYTAKSFKMDVSKANDFAINGSVGSETLIIDINDTSKGNDTSGTIAMNSATTVATSLTVNCNVTFENSATPDQY